MRCRFCIDPRIRWESGDALAPCFTFPVDARTKTNSSLRTLRLAFSPKLLCSAVTSFASHRVQSASPALFGVGRPNASLQEMKAVYARVEGVGLILARVLKMQAFLGGNAG